MQVHGALNNKCLWTLPLRSVSDQRQGGRWNFQFFPTNFQQRRLRFSVVYAYYKFCTLFYLYLKCLNRTVKFKSQDLLFQTLRMRRGMMRLNHKRCFLFMFLFWYFLVPVWFALYLLSCTLLGYVNVIMYRRLSLGASGVVCWFCPVCPLGFLVVTSLVVGFLGYTLELFWTVCNLLVIVNRVNYFFCIHGSVVWIGLLWPVRQIVICLLLSWRDSLSKVSVWWSWLWNAVWSVKNKICLLLSWRVVKIELLWPVRQLWFACYCHGVILSASCLFDDHDCEMLYGQWRMSFACYYHDGIIWIELLWPVRQLWFAYYLQYSKSKREAKTLK